MVSKNQIKIITSLQQKKYRSLHGLFIAEGAKVINEFATAGFQLESAYTTSADLFVIDAEKLQLINDAELKRISCLKTPNQALALFYIPKEQSIKDTQLTIVLDDVRDPGNLGTIIRLCDWFGVSQLVCSPKTADCYNPKVVQASMGSLARVSVVYTELSNYLQQTNRLVFGAFMDGEPVYGLDLPKEAVLVMGNEGNGISAEVEKLITKRISIPRFGKLQATESLNVAMAASILLNEFSRSTYKTIQR